MTQRRIVLGLLLAALILPACQDPVEEAEPAAAPSAPPLGLSVTQNRVDQGTLRVAVKVANEGASTVWVERVGLDVAGFGEGEPNSDPARLTPGLRADLPVMLGEADCEGGVPSSAGEPEVTLTVRPEGGQPQEVRQVLPPQVVLDELLVDLCEIRAIGEAVDIRFGESWTFEGATMLGTIQMRRLDSRERIALTGIGGTVLYNLRPVPDRPAPLLVLEPGMDAAELPVQFTVGRCDGHALSQSRQSFRFSTWVSLGDAPEEYAPLVPPEDVREPWLELTRIGCGL